MGNIYLLQQSTESPLPNKSRLTIVIAPGAEKLAEDSQHLRMREGPMMSKGIVALNQLVTQLSNLQYADRVVNYS